MKRAIIIFNLTRSGLDIFGGISCINSSCEYFVNL